MRRRLPGEQPVIAEAAQVHAHRVGGRRGVPVAHGVCGGISMAITTDYDAPRRSTLQEAETESLDALATAAKTAARSPDVDPEESDTAEGIDLPGADLSGEVLTMPVVPQQADEFTCTSCFLVHHSSRIAAHTAGRLVCIDCA